MWTEVRQILGQSGRQIAEHVANFLPGMLVALLLIATTIVIAVFVRFLVGRTLRSVEFDTRADQWGMPSMLGRPSAARPSQTVAGAAYWAVLVLGLLVSLTALDATMPSRLAIAVFEYLPHLVAALIILVVGTIAARFLSYSVLIGAVNMQMQSARLLSLSVGWLVRLIAVAMALDHLGIGRSILLLAFGLFFGGVVLAASLAIGLGARDAVKRAIDRQFREPVRDKVTHI